MSLLLVLYFSILAKVYFIMRVKISGRVFLFFPFSIETILFTGVQY